MGKRAEILQNIHQERLEKYCFIRIVARSKPKILMNSAASENIRETSDPICMHWQPRAKTNSCQIQPKKWIETRPIFYRETGCVILGNSQIDYLLRWDELFYCIFKHLGKLSQS